MDGLLLTLKKSFSPTENKQSFFSPPENQQRNKTTDDSTKHNFLFILKPTLNALLHDYFISCLLAFC